MKKISPIKILLASILLTAAGCADGGGDSTTGDGVPLAGDPAPTNPIASRQFFGEGGNLYKPVSDGHSSTPGNLVVLLSAQFTTQFDSCEARKNTGEVEQLICINDQPWTHVPYSCFSNGGRQTWRASFKCHEMAEVKVVCRDANQEVTFTVPDAQLGQICTRFG